MESVIQVKKMYLKMLKILKIPWKIETINEIFIKLAYKKYPLSNFISPELPCTLQLRDITSSSDAHATGMQRIYFCKIISVIFWQQYK